MIGAEYEKYSVPFFFVDFSCLKKYNIVRFKAQKKSEKGGRHDRQNGMVSE